MPPRIRSLLLASAGGFDGFTIAWIVVGLANTGDAFPQGPARTLLPLIAVGPLLGAFAGTRARSRPAVATLLVLTALAAAFWTFAPGNWWAAGPPMPGSH